MAERIGRQSPTQSFVLPYRDTAGPEAVEIYEKSGREPYDWQKLLDYACRNVFVRLMRK